MLHGIVENFQSNQKVIDDFFHEKIKGLIPPLYLSCDIRNSGRKIGVIDTNLFPAGFNNLCNAYSRVTTVALKEYFNKHFPEVKNIILLSEEHTRNRYYLENIYHLNSLIQSTGLKTRIGFVGLEIDKLKIEVPLAQDKMLQLEKITIKDGVPHIQDFEGDLLISNNDFTSGIPEILHPIKDKIWPPPELGWYRRRKSTHFDILQKLILEFSERINMDPWLISCIYRGIPEINLNQEEDQRNLFEVVQSVYSDIEEKYLNYKIEDSPYLFIKNNAGTYGMGLVDVGHPDEIKSLNRKIRNKLLSTKGGSKTSSILIQEGIPTADFYSGLPIEPVIYMIGFEPVGGFFRMNPQQDSYRSLNTRGMIFSCLCLHKLDEPHEEDFLNCAEKENLVKLSNVMARLAALAAAEEMKLIRGD